MATDYGLLLDEEEGRLQDDTLSSSYADVLDSEDTAQRQNLLQAQQTSPDDYARSRQLEAQTGIPAPVVERNSQEVTRRAQLAQAESTLRDSPVLAAQVAEDADFARLAVDDLENASLIEQAAGVFARAGRSLAAGVPAFSAGVYGALEATSESANAILPGDPLDGVSSFIRDVRKAQQLLQHRVAGPEAGGRFERAVNSGFQSVGQGAAPLAASIFTGNPMIALGALTTSAGGAEYADARDAGVPIQQALPYAASQAAIEYATEKMPLTWFLKDLAEGSGFVTTLARNVASEVPGEQVATILQDLNTWAVLHPEATFKDYIAERPGAAADTLVATLVAAGTQVGAVKAVDSAARRISERRADADAATQDADALANLNRLVAESKLRARDPATFEKFIERVVTESGAAPADVFIDSTTLAEALEQTKVDPAVLAQLSPTLAAQLSDAAVAGGDVTIRTSEFASRFAGTEIGDALLPHLRTSPAGMSSSEAQAFYDAESANFESELQAELAGERTDAPLFQTAEQAQMTPEEFSEYASTDATQAAVDQLDARTLRDLRWLSNAKAAQLKELQADADEKRKTVRSEVAAEVAIEPIYQARRFLSRGELPDGQVVGDLAGSSKLSIPALKELYGDGPAAPWRYLSTGKFGTMAAEDGIDPAVAGAMFGFQSGDAFVRALLEAAPINERIEAGTDQRMLERFGDLSDPKVLERAAEAAIASEVRARNNSRELAALQQATGAGPTFLRAARDFAEGLISQKNIRDVRPAQHGHAEARAAKAAMQWLKAGDTAQAAVSKRAQLVQNRLNRVATEVREEVDASLTFLRKFDREGTRKNLDPAYLDQIDSLLERFDLRKSVSIREIDKRKSLLEFVQSQQEQGLDPIIDERLLNEARRQHYQEMAVSDFRSLVAAVKNIEHLGRLKQKLLTARDQRELALILADVESSIRGNATREIKQKIESNLPADRAHAFVAGFAASHRKLPSLVREMDGGKDGGTLWELFMRPLNEAGDFEAVEREKATEKLAVLFKQLGGKMRTRMHVPAIGESLSREGRLAVALNWGNEANRQRITDGERWSASQAQAVLDTLTKEEWDFVQATWDFIDSYWPQIKAKEERVSGIAPDKVEAAPVQTKFGEYKGGYYPIKYDPIRSSRSEADDASEALRQTMQGLYTRASTRRGHTKARAESVNRPMRKDLGVLFEHVNQVIHDLAFHEALIDTNRILRSTVVDEAIRDHYGAATLRTMRKALDDIATGDVPAQTDFEKGMSYLRNGVSIAGLGWNLMTSALQPLGLSQSMVRVGPKWIGRGVARWLGGAARMENVVKDIYARSEFMRLRGKTFNRELNEIQNRVRADGGLRLAVESSYFYFIQKMQMVADLPTWLGQYEKSLGEGNDEARSVALADQAVIDSQGSGQIKDMAEIQRGGPLLKLWTNFYSFFNTTYNLAAESYRRTDLKKPEQVGRMAVDFLLLFTVPAVLGSMLKTALRGDEDDEEDLGKKLVREQLGYMTGSMVGVRELSSVLAGFNGYSGPAGTRAFSELSKLMVQTEQGDVDDAALKALNNTAGILFHYPSGQVQRTVEGVRAVIEEDAPAQAIVFGPPR